MTKIVSNQQRFIKEVAKINDINSDYYSTFIENSEFLEDFENLILKNA